MFANSLAPPRCPGIQILDFVADVRPLYDDANVVIVPNVVSAGTNIKVLEAMAMERAIVGTACGCAGLGLEHGKSAWICSDAESLADGVIRLLGDPGLRRKLAMEARSIAERDFDWRAIGSRLRSLYWELLEERRCGRSTPKS
jgi:glycosyltransferase involved in cell wall biosynthesis